MSEVPLYVVPARRDHARTLFPFAGIMADKQKHVSARDEMPGQEHFNRTLPRLTAEVLATFRQS